MASGGIRSYNLRPRGHWDRHAVYSDGAAKDILRLPHRWQRVVHNAGDYFEGE